MGDQGFLAGFRAVNPLGLLNRNDLEKPDPLGQPLWGVSALQRNDLEDRRESKSVRCAASEVCGDGSGTAEAWGDGKRDRELAKSL
jgi:hypothetical protein